MKRRSLLSAALLPAFARAQTQPRIVCVGGAVTETVFALGAQGQLVGVDTTSLFPVDATRLPQVGYARTLSAEGVLALKPQLLLASGEAGPPLVLTQLKSAGLRVEVLDEQHRFDGVLARTQRVGALCGREREAALQAAPDIILCTDQGLEAQGGADGLLKAPGLALTPAGRARRVVGMEALLLLGFGPRLPQAVAELTRQLHGRAA